VRRSKTREKKYEREDTLAQQKTPEKRERKEKSTKMIIRTGKSEVGQGKAQGAARQKTKISLMLQGCSKYLCIAPDMLFNVFREDPQNLALVTRLN
jgi:hypothetical protein